MGEALVKVEDRLGWVAGSREVGWAMAFPE